MALEALMKAAKEVAPEILDSLVTSIYQIEKDHQFDKADQRETAVKLIQKIIDDELELRGIGGL